jgi:hypothetical protein
MKLTTEELVRRARKVAKLYNGHVAPRAMQLEAMKDLQDFIHALDSTPTGPKTSSEGRPGERDQA